MSKKIGGRIHKILKILCFSLVLSALVATPLLISSCKKNEFDTKVHISILTQPENFNYMIGSPNDETHLIISYPSQFNEYSLISCVFSNSVYFYTSNVSHLSNTTNFTIKVRNYQEGDEYVTNITLNYSGTSFDVTFDNVNSITARC